MFKIRITYTHAQKQHHTAQSHPVLRQKLRRDALWQVPAGDNGDLARRGTCRRLGAAVLVVVLAHVSQCRFHGALHHRLHRCLVEHVSLSAGKAWDVATLGSLAC